MSPTNNTELLCPRLPIVESHVGKRDGGEPNDTTIHPIQSSIASNNLKDHLEIESPKNNLQRSRCEILISSVKLTLCELERSTIFLMGKSTLSMAIFNSKLLVYQICQNIGDPMNGLKNPWVFPGNAQLFLGVLTYVGDLFLCKFCKTSSLGSLWRQLGVPNMAGPRPPATPPHLDSFPRLEMATFAHVYPYSIHNWASV